MTQVRIRISTAVSKQLTVTLRQAYQAGDLRLVRRVSALPVDGVERRWGGWPDWAITTPLDTAAQQISLGAIAYIVSAMRLTKARF